MSTISALFAGAFDGKKTIEELRKHGDFGFGFIDQLDGEMIALDGEFYKINYDGQTFPVSDLRKTAFAAVTFFEMDKVVEFHDGPYLRLDEVIKKGKKKNPTRLNECIYRYVLYI